MKNKNRNFVRLRGRILLILVILIFYLTFNVLPSQGYMVKGVPAGIYPGSQEIWEYEEELDVEFNHILRFQSVKNLNYSEVVFYLDLGYEVILNIEFQENFANLDEVAAGLYDAYLFELADQINGDGRTIWLRPLHEFNGDWYNWGVFYSGNSVEDFISAWRHVVQLFRSQNAPVRFQLNYNRYNGREDPTPFSEFWPGDGWVDMVVITNYNRAYTDQWHQFWHTFTEDFEDAYLQITALTEKPIGVAEMSSTIYGGNKSQGIMDAFNSIVYEYPRIEQVTWFLRNKRVGGVVWDWDLNTQQEKDAFKQGMNLLNNTISIRSTLAVRGLDDRIYYRIYDSHSDFWQSWKRVSSGLTVDSPATAVCSGKLYMVVRGLDGNSLWFSSINLSDYSFSGWNYISGCTESAPTLVSYDSQLILTIRGLDNRIYYRQYNCTSKVWDDWKVLPSGITCDGIAGAVLDSSFHFVVRGVDGYSIWHGILDLYKDIFEGGSLVGGATESMPALTCSESNLILVVRGLDNRIYHRTYNESWRDWNVLASGATLDSPTVTSLDNELHMVVCGTDGNSLWHSSLNLNTTIFSDWKIVWGATESKPRIAA